MKAPLLINVRCVLSVDIGVSAESIGFVGSLVA